MSRENGQGDLLLQMLREMDLHPVLVDIGASGAPPAIWERIAGESIYIGFDPAATGEENRSREKYLRSYLVPKAISLEPKGGYSRFYVTRSPDCASTLRPDLPSLAHYLFADLFALQKEIDVPALTLREFLSSHEFSRIHWLKTDSQGADLRLFQSLPKEICSQVLAVDMEPGLIDAYHDEDLFVDVHRHMVRHGFWLSSLKLRGSVRVKRATLSALPGRIAKIDRAALLERGARKSPARCEARYLRTIEWLVDQRFEANDFLLLWIFALLDQQAGFALDLAMEAREVMGDDRTVRMMEKEPLRHILRAGKEGLLPSLIRWLKNLFNPRISRFSGSLRPKATPAALELE